MASRESVARALAALRVQWKSVDDSEAMLSQLARGVADYDDDELRIAIDRLCVTHRAGWPPKVADIADACAGVAKWRRAPAVRAAHNDKADAYCTLCGTRVMVQSQPWPSGHSRDVPWHEPDCPRAGAEDQPARAVMMHAWPNRQAHTKGVGGVNR